MKILKKNIVLGLFAFLSFGGSEAALAGILNLDKCCNNCTNYTSTYKHRLNNIRRCDVRSAYLEELIARKCVSCAAEETLVSEEPKIIVPEQPKKELIMPQDPGIPAPQPKPIFYKGLW